MVPQHSQDGSIMSRTDNFESLTSTTTSHNVHLLQQHQQQQQPQQQLQQQQSNGIIFGSQLVDKNSNTPYSDATQVS